MTKNGQKDLLLSVVTKFATMRIARDGFLPFGAVLGSKRNVVMLMPKSVKQNVSREELEAYWIKVVCEEAHTEDCTAICFCADVRVPNADSTHVPAVFVHIEQPAGSSEDMLYPYEKTPDGTVRLGKPTSVDTEYRMLPSPSSKT